MKSAALIFAITSGLYAQTNYSESCAKVDAVCSMRWGAAHGNGNSAALLGDMILRGELGNPPNIKEAIQFFKTGVQDGSRLAMSMVAMAYLNGSPGFPQNRVLADQWSAASKGGRVPKTPIGAAGPIDFDPPPVAEKIPACNPRNVQNATAEQARLNAQKLDKMTDDYPLLGFAMECWYDAAAEKGDIAAQTEYGKMLLLMRSGSGAIGSANPENEKGLKYLNAAIKAGSADAMWTLANFYADDSSPYIDYDLDKANYWWAQARKRMTPAQIASRRAKEAARSAGRAQEKAEEAKSDAAFRERLKYEEEWQRQDRMDRVYGNKTNGAPW